MKIKMRYDDAYQTLEVETKEIEKWLNISISDDESEEDYEKRVQEEIEVRFNRPEYNSWHKLNRHMGDAYWRSNDGTVEVNTEEAIMHHAADQSVYTQGLDDIEREMDNEIEYRNLSKKLREVLKPEIADMVIAIVLDEVTVSEYAEKIGDTPNNVSHRYRRAIKKLQKVFE